MNHRMLFFAIELNLVLWIVAGVRTGWDPAVVVGLVLSALVQHSAYYAMVRKPRTAVSRGDAAP